jgi:hypothetical protein
MNLGTRNLLFLIHDIHLLIGVAWGVLRESESHRAPSNHRAATMELSNSKISIRTGEVRFLTIDLRSQLHEPCSRGCSETL